MPAHWWCDARPLASEADACATPGIGAAYWCDGGALGRGRLRMCSMPCGVADTGEPSDDALPASSGVADSATGDP